MNYKIQHDECFTEKELLMIGLLCFMRFDREVEYVIHDSALTISNIKNSNEDISQFVKGIVLMLCDKFVKDESLNKTISNLLGGNMKIVKEYAQRSVYEKTEEVIFNLKE